MLNFFKKYWHKALVWLAFIPLCVRVFLRWTPLAIGLAAIPIDQFITHKLVERFGLGMVSARLISFTLTFFLMYVAWHVGEVIVALMALAMVGEAYTLVGCIRDRLEFGHTEQCAAV